MLVMSVSAIIILSFYALRKERLVLLPTNVSVKSKLKHPPRAYPGHLASFAAREGGNLMNLVSLGAGHLITTHRGWGI